MGNKNIQHNNKDINREKKYPNRFLKRNILKSQLTQDEQNILNSLEKSKYGYYCHYCNKFPVITFSKELDPREQYSSTMIQLTLEEDNWNTKGDYKSYQFRDDEFTCGVKIENIDFIENYKLNQMVKGKYIKEKSDDLLPFETLDDCHEYLKVAKKFLELKEKIKLYNFDDHKNNYVYEFFELLLTNGLYGFGTLYEYHNALSIYNFLNFEDLKQYNIGFDLKDGDIIYELKKFNLYQVVKIKKLNNNDLFAFIVDVNYSFSSFGIFLEKLTIENKFVDSFNFNNKYLEYKEPNLPHKKILLKYENYNFEDIIELEKDKYLLLLSNNQLIIATFNENSNNYEYNIIPDLKCIMFLKLKSGKIIIINELNIILMKFSDNELKVIKTQTITLSFFNNNGKFKFLSYELLNGNIVFTINDKSFCYFNIKTFQIQFIFNFKSKIDDGDNYYIKHFNQFKDKNILYCSFENVGCYKINLKNSKIEKQLLNYAKSIKIDKYIIMNILNLLIINDEKNSFIFNKKLLALDELILINEKSKMFASIGYLLNSLGAYIYIFKINNK